MLATFMGEDTPEVRARFLASIPIGRFSTPADIAAAAVYLCSQEASMVTGVAMEADAGGASSDRPLRLERVLGPGL